MNDIKVIIGILFLVWALVGPIYYLYVSSKVKLRAQKFILFLVSGPFIWLGLPLFFVLEKLSENVFEPLHKWLTKE
jgi:hypothetical protein